MMARRSFHALEQVPQKSHGGVGGVFESSIRSDFWPKRLSSRTSDLCGTILDRTEDSAKVRSGLQLPLVRSTAEMYIVIIKCTTQVAHAQTLVGLDLTLGRRAARRRRQPTLAARG